MLSGFLATTTVQVLSGLMLESVINRLISVFRASEFREVVYGLAGGNFERCDKVCG